MFRSPCSASARRYLPCEGPGSPGPSRAPKAPPLLARPAAEAGLDGGDVEVAVELHRDLAAVRLRRCASYAALPESVSTRMTVAPGTAASAAALARTAAVPGGGGAARAGGIFGRGRL